MSYGPITIVGCSQTADGRLKLIAAEGETLHIGNTNSRVRFSLRVAEFFERWCDEGPTHHAALGVGHRLDEVCKVASLLGFEFATVGA